MMSSSVRIGSASRNGNFSPISGGKPIEMEEAIALKTLILGSGRKNYPEGWPGQAFSFQNKEDLQFGLVQNRGGPCGVLAVIQAFILKNLLFKDGEMANLKPSKGQREKALVRTLTQILLNVS